MMLIEEKSYHALRDMVTQSMDLAVTLGKIWSASVEENNKLRAELEALQVATCAEVDELKRKIDGQRRTIEAQGQRNREYFDEVTELKAQAGQWVPVEDKNKISCATGDGYTFDIWDGGECLTIHGCNDNDLTVQLGDLRICRKVEGEKETEVNFTDRDHFLQALEDAHIEEVQKLWEYGKKRGYLP